jgi:SpoVK/Ycf46/Vps4 family AAA+-type ATPase
MSNIVAKIDSKSLIETDAVIVVEMQHFERALADIRPSIGDAELRRYSALQHIV